MPACMYVLMVFRRQTDILEKLTLCRTGVAHDAHVDIATNARLLQRFLVDTTQPGYGVYITTFLVILFTNLTLIGIISSR